VLFERSILEGLAAGTITLAFRRWRRSRVRTGSRLRTPIGVLSVEAQEVVEVASITEADARRAGYPSRAELVAALDGYGDGPVHRIALRYAGPDPRIALRERGTLSDAELRVLRTRLARLDASSRHGRWTLATLRLIDERPGARAADLAASVGRPPPAFKADVRKLKELGLTESLTVGYRLSPRGRAVLLRLG
jgi:hypothetical protein